MEGLNYSVHLLRVCHTATSEVIRAHIGLTLCSGMAVLLSSAIRKATLMGFCTPAVPAF